MHTKLAALTGVILSFHLAAGATEPSEIIHDAFAGTKGASVDNRPPDKANHPGGNWSVLSYEMGGVFQATLDTDAATNSPCIDLTCYGNSTGAVAIPRSNPASATKEQHFNISAELCGIDPSLGFYSALTKQDAFGGADAFLNFTGLRLAPDGALSLYRQGGMVSTVAYSGTFDPKVFHTLSYEVDTSSGTISNVNLQGSTSDYSSFSATKAFTPEATAYAGLAVLCEGGRDNQAYAKGFIVASVPASGASTSPAPAKSADSSSPIVIKTGDRIGFHGRLDHGAGRSSKGYIQLVIAGLKAEGVDAVAVPAGHSGDTSGNMVGRVNIDVLHKGANWMTLSCGVNDVFHTDGVDLESYKKNVETMFKKIQAWNARMVVLTATPLGEDSTNREQPEARGLQRFSA